MPVNGDRGKRKTCTAGLPSSQHATPLVHCIAHTHRMSSFVMESCRIVKVNFMMSDMKLGTRQKDDGAPGTMTVNKVFSLWFMLTCLISEANLVLTDCEMRR